MRPIAITALVLLLASCAITPNELRASRPEGEFLRRSAPPALAECFEQKLRNMHGDLTAHRELMPGGRIDVTGRTRDRGAVFIYEISPREDGSSILVYIHPDLFEGQRRSIAAQMVSGC